MALGVQSEREELFSTGVGVYKEKSIGNLGVLMEIFPLIKPPSALPRKLAV